MSRLGYSTCNLDDAMIHRTTLYDVGATTIQYAPYPSLHLKLTLAPYPSLHLKLTLAPYPSAHVRLTLSTLSVNLPKTTKRPYPPTHLRLLRLIMCVSVEQHHLQQTAVEKKAQSLGGKPSYFGSPSPSKASPTMRL